MTEKLDDRGFSEQFKRQVASSIRLMNEKPQYFREITEFSVLKEVLCDSEGRAPADEDKAIERLVEVYVAGTREVKLGGAQTWDETKAEDSTVKCRRCHGNCYARYSHPSLDEIWGDVLECSKVAAAAATIAAIWASPSAALPTFKAAFYACLQAKGIGWASSSSVSLFTRSECGSWHGCG